MMDGVPRTLLIHIPNSYVCRLSYRPFGSLLQSTLVVISSSSNHNISTKEKKNWTLKPPSKGFKVDHSG